MRYCWNYVKSGCAVAGFYYTKLLLVVQFVVMSHSTRLQMDVSLMASFL